MLLKIRKRVIIATKCVKNYISTDIVPSISQAYLSDSIRLLDKTGLKLDALEYGGRGGNK